MTVTENPQQFIFQSEDDNGTFELRVHKDCSQIQFETDMDTFPNEVYADIDRKELEAIRNMLNKILV